MKKCVIPVHFVWVQHGAVALGCSGGGGCCGSAEMGLPSSYVSILDLMDGRFSMDSRFACCSSTLRLLLELFFLKIDLISCPAGWLILHGVFKSFLSGV